MENKNLWIIVGIVAVILIVIGFMYYDKAPEGNLNEALDGATPEIDIPSANPLSEIVPDVNPIETANPFDDLKVNPFQ